VSGKKRPWVWVFGGGGPGWLWGESLQLGESLAEKLGCWAEVEARLLLVLGCKSRAACSGTGARGGVASTACHDWIMEQWGEGRQAMWPADPELKQETKIVPFFQLFPPPRNLSKILSILISSSSAFT
jgi:hypothetical protein